jgi:hypothetical protein
MDTEPPETRSGKNSVRRDHGAGSALQLILGAQQLGLTPGK